jgi:tetratricopeptide (TPR) repeat protein
VTGDQHSVIVAGLRAALARLFTGLQPALLAAVAVDLFRTEQFSADLQWGDVDAVVGRISAIPAGPDGIPPLLAFAAGVAAELSGPRALQVDQWVDRVVHLMDTDRAALGLPAPARSAAEHGSGEHGQDSRINTKSEAFSDNGSQGSSPSEESRVVTVTDRSGATLLEPTRASQESRVRPRLWGGVPPRNPAFIGREALLLELRRALERRSKASLLSRTRREPGGVGKTQLAAEFVYRYADRYDIVWWIPADHQSLVLQSLSQLGRRLDAPETADLDHAAGRVLEKLAGDGLRWLLIYDNANEPEDVARLLPDRGGHVIVTSRDQTWSEIVDPVRVDVFGRAESVALVRRRSEGVSPQEASRLADVLGDLPLAVDLAASCQAAMGMSVAEYLAEFDQDMRDVSTRRSDRLQIAALVRLALRRMRATATAAAELLELFGFLAAEPISAALLRRGRDARVSQALGHALRDQIAWDRAIRDLRRYGLAKVDTDQRIQVHRLFQEALREELTEETAQRGRTNVQRLLAAANPGYPYNMDTWPIHAEIGPHIGPAGLLDAGLLDARRVVLDQARYLNGIGEIEGCRRVSEIAVHTWSKVEGTEGVGPDGELTLRAALCLAAALRYLGFNDRARSLVEGAYDRLRRSPEFGPDHEFALSAADSLALCLRVSGLYREALTSDRENLVRHRRIFGDDHAETLKVRNNVAVNLRLLGDFWGAHEIDVDVVRIWRQSVSEDDNRLLFSQTNLARDLCGVGLYSEALALLQRILPPYRRQLGVRHPNVLLADRTLAIALRKTGQYQAALIAAAEHDRDSESRYGPQHEHALAAATTHANALRAIGDLVEAHRRAGEAMDRYLLVFGEDHPLALAAVVNYAVGLRGLGELTQAREVDERAYVRMRDVLGSDHEYTLCAASNLASDFALTGELGEARRLSAETLEASRRVRGRPHPYSLACTVNAALDTLATGSRDDGQALFDEAVAELGEVLGAGHPETVAAREGRRMESDIEPPPA